MTLAILLLQCLCFCPSDTFENNNTIADAYYLGSYPYSQVEANIYPSGDIDYFEFTVSSIITITFVRKNLNYHFNMKCSDSSGMLTINQNPFYQITVIYSPFAPVVTCRLFVYGAGGASNPGCYKLYIK